MHVLQVALHKSFHILHSSFHKGCHIISESQDHVLCPSIAFLVVYVDMQLLQILLSCSVYGDVNATARARLDRLRAKVTRVQIRWACTLHLLQPLPCSPRCAALISITGRALDRAQEDPLRTHV